jgi:hypothetical protein
VTAVGPEPAPSGQFRNSSHDYGASRTNNLFPAGFLNHAIVGPFPREIPRSSVFRWGSLAPWLRLLASLPMRRSFIDDPCEKRNCTDEHNAEKNCRRPEQPGPLVSFSDVLGRIAQRKSRSYRAPWTEKEGGHKTVPLRSPASMPKTVISRQHDQEDVNSCNKIRYAQAYFA